MSKMHHAVNYAVLVAAVVFMALLAKRNADIYWDVIAYEPDGSRENPYCHLLDVPVGPVLPSTYIDPTDFRCVIQRRARVAYFGLGLEEQ